ncbi:MAG: hypothetical protein COV09_00605 [Candidatus Vogelbacteria bacterium CG10_big_fil_rev_8_21_14_0_10_50_13]|uniref:ComEC/Rec2-related protein domain-containing protein n=1 Tax=Candidatus Vogelbacteria bacterium CG10_big_fil_rev_8_21_14_0_10_50_13 TaxID=1975044 RepID=A0A2H0RGF6_9BACT|nr:MAG: hypothetical protein COV09_00605 [Candidatus Vogelbacteria bacterium CG10_big_fil_rev_8_21_14_0_10_50_13]
MANQILILTASGFVAGMGWGLIWPVDWSVIGLIAVLAVGLLLLNRPFDRAWGKKNYWLVSVILLGVALGLGRVYFLPAPSSELIAQVGQTITVEGKIATEPDERLNFVQLFVRPDGYRDKILVRAPLYPEFSYGDIVLVTGKLEWPENFTTETGRQFDYQKYLNKDGVFFIINRPTVELTTPAELSLRGGLFEIKRAFSARLGQMISEPAVSLLDGLILGEKQGLGTEWNERFRVVGLSHIVVLSGYNLSVVAENLLRLAGWLLPRAGALGAGATGVILFTSLAGAGPAATRAAVMALLALLARATGRVYAATRALAIAGLLMIVWNPAVLLYDLGFQLSFIATLGVIHGPSLLEPYFKRVPVWLGLREIALVTISAQIAVLPLILYATGNLSLFGLPANLLVLPVIPLTMLFGFLAGLLGLIYLPFGLLFAYLAYFLLYYILLMTKLFALLPGASLALPEFPLVVLILMYAGLAWLVWKIRQKKVPALSLSKGGDELMS